MNLYEWWECWLSMRSCEHCSAVKTGVTGGWRATGGTTDYFAPNTGESAINDQIQGNQQ